MEQSKQDLKMMSVFIYQAAVEDSPKPSEQLKPSSYPLVDKIWASLQWFESVFDALRLTIGCMLFLQ